MSQIRMLAPPDVRVLIVGNKVDLDNQRVITTEQGQSLADSYNLGFFEVSAKTGHNVSEIFQNMSELVLDKIKNSPNQNGNSDGAQDLDAQTAVRKRGCC